MHFEESLDYECPILHLRMNYAVDIAKYSEGPFLACHEIQSV